MDIIPDEVKNIRLKHPDHWFRWLGSSCLLFEIDDFRLVFDPFVTRPMPLRFWLGRPASNRKTAGKYLRRPDAAVVRSVRWDHCLDASYCAGLDSCNLYLASDVKQAKIELKEEKIITSGDQLNLPGIKIGFLEEKTLPDVQKIYPLEPLLNRLPPNRKWEVLLNAQTCLGAVVEINGLRLLLPGSPAQLADILFLRPFVRFPEEKPEDYQAILDTVNPKVVFIVGWDDILRPFSRSFEPMNLPVGGLRYRFFNPYVLKDVLLGFRPELKVFVPEVFERYWLPYFGGLGKM